MDVGAGSGAAAASAGGMDVSGAPDLAAENAEAARVMGQLFAQNAAFIAHAAAEKMSLATLPDMAPAILEVDASGAEAAEAEAVLVKAVAVAAAARVRTANETQKSILAASGALRPHLAAAVAATVDTQAGALRLYTSVGVAVVTRDAVVFGAVAFANRFQARLRPSLQAFLLREHCLAVVRSLESTVVHSIARLIVKLDVGYKTEAGVLPAVKALLFWALRKALVDVDDDDGAVGAGGGASPTLDPATLLSRLEGVVQLPTDKSSKVRPPFLANLSLARDWAKSQQGEAVSYENLANLYLSLENHGKGKRGRTSYDSTPNGEAGAAAEGGRRPTTTPVPVPA
jgi:hypothetical protein